MYKIIVYADPKQEDHQRAIYNFLDFLGDVGGLRDALGLISRFLLGFVM